MLFPYPQNNAVFSWREATTTPSVPTTLVAKGGIDGYEIPWQYTLYRMEAEPISGYFLKVEGAPAPGSVIRYYWDTPPMGPVSGSLSIQFKPYDSEAPSPQPDPEPVGGSCASRRMMDAIINGREACVSMSYYPSYALRLASVVVAGAIAGAAINKKKRSKGAIVGALVGSGAAAALGLTGILRPTFVYKE
jgi:hypothetical protein